MSQEPQKPTLYRRYRTINKTCAPYLSVILYLPSSNKRHIKTELRSLLFFFLSNAAAQSYKPGARLCVYVFEGSAFYGAWKVQQGREAAQLMPAIRDKNAVRIIILIFFFLSAPCVCHA